MLTREDIRTEDIGRRVHNTDWDSKFLRDGVLVRLWFDEERRYYGGDGAAVLCDDGMERMHALYQLEWADPAPLVDAELATKTLESAEGYFVYVARSLLYHEHEQHGPYLLAQLRTAIRMAQQVETWLAGVVEEDAEPRRGIFHAKTGA